MKKIVVKLGVYLITTAIAWAAVTEGGKSPGRVLDNKEKAIHNADFAEMSEEVLDFDYWNLTSYRNNRALNGHCDLEGYNPCNSNSKMYHKHPSKCEYFIQCSNNIAYCIKCSTGEHWKVSMGGGKCMPKENAGCTECECGEENTKRIIGGDVVSRARKYPWMVGIKRPSDSEYDCGGSIINDRWILTAAHCVVETRNLCNKLKSFAYSLEVWVGDHIQNNVKDDLQGLKMTYGITDIVPHCEYNCDTKIYDVALLELDNPIVFDDIIRPICLPKDDSETYVGKTGLATGWGRIANSPPRPQPQAPVATDLKEVVLTIRANDDCGSYPNESGFCNPGTTPIASPVKLCAAGGPGDATCAGDSGGPLFILENNKHVLVGVYSGSSQNCLNPNGPSRFTRVSKVLEWIDRITIDAKKCI